MLWRRASECS
jgi:hypothetical protein